MDPMDIQAVESKLSDVTVTAIPMINKPSLQITPVLQQMPTITSQQQGISLHPISHTHTSRVSVDLTPGPSTITSPQNQTNNSGLSKYAQLLAVIEEMGRDIRPTYSGSRSSSERLKRGIVHARILVRECLVETERSARQ